MNPIHNPFSRDEHPDLTAAILGVVNESHTRAQLEKKSTTELRALRKTHASKGAKADSRSAETLAHIHGILRSRGAGAALDEDAMTAERDAELRGKMKREKDYGGYRKLRAQREKEAKSKKLYGMGGKVDTSRKPDVSKSKQIWEAESPTEGKKPSNPFNPTLGDLLRSKAQDKKAPKPKPVKEDAQLDEDLMTAARKAELDKKIKSAVSGVGKKQRRLDTVKRQADRSVKKAHNTLWNSISKSHGLRDKKEKEANSPILYGKGGKVLKRKVQEDAQLDERIIDEVDFFQASKNWIKGKGFKTNREATYDRVNKNYAAMKKREAAAKAKKTK